MFRNIVVSASCTSFTQCFNALNSATFYVVFRQNRFCSAVDFSYFHHIFFVVWFVYVPACLSVSLPVCLSVCLSVCYIRALCLNRFIDLDVIWYTCGVK